MWRLYSTILNTIPYNGSLLIFRIILWKALAKPGNILRSTDILALLVDSVCNFLLLALFGAVNYVYLFAARRLR